MKNTISTMRRTQVRPELTRSGAPWLRYKKLAFSLALAAGSLSVAGAASAASGVAAGAGPTGGTVVGGVGSITQNGASTVINQQSKLLSLNWQTFNVGKDASVLFNQPSFNAVALNRILDQSPSQIFGRINSNGQIFLINTHGIIFGSSAQLNVGGLVASTLDLTPDDFLKEHFNLDAHGGHAGIVNQGTIAAASGGSVSLIGGHVENDGLIVANYGRINLDGADKAVLDFDGDGLVNIQITGALEQRLDTEQAAVANKGSLRADSGTVVLQASAAKDLFTDLVNNSGVIDAHGISTDGGVVRLVGNGGNTVSSGSIDVSGVHGGSAQLLSDQNVGVTGGSINVSGTQGGGSIRVGGGWQGGEGLQTASATYVAPDATLNADATQSGNGGSVVVWGNNANNFYGRISARGGANGGNGGRVETSSHYGLNAQGAVDASAPRGLAGTWLLDPYNVTISTGADTNTGTAPDYTASGTGSVVNAGEIDAALTGNTDVFVFTNNASTGAEAGNITLSAPISAAGAGSLYLQAVGSILLDNTITAKSTTKPLNVYLWANYGGAAGGLNYTGNTTCSACQVIIGSSANAGITTDGGNVFIQTGDALHVGGSVQLGSSTATGFINAGTGSVNVIATGISQQATGASTITAGVASLAAGAQSIALTNAGNNFTGTVSLSNSGAYNVALNNGSNALTLGNVTVGTGTLSLSGAGLSQAASTTITQGAGAGAVTLNGGAGAINLANSGNDFTGTVSLSNSGANNVALNNGSNALTLGNVTVGTGTLSLGGAGLSQAAGTAITQGAGAGAVTLNGGAGAITLTNTGNDFTGTVSLSNSGANNVALDNGSNVLTLGTASVGGSFDVASSGGITLTQNVSSGAAQTYENAVTLGNDVVAASTGNGAIDFVSTVDGAHNLTVNTGGVTTFGGVVGGTTALTSLTTDAGGSTALDGNVSTTGAQTYNDAVKLGNNITLTSSGNGNITFGFTLDSAGSSTPNLTVNTGGTTTFAGDVGDTRMLGKLDVVQGTTVLDGSSIITSVGQTYGGPVLLGTDVSLSDDAGGVTFDSTVDNASATQHTLSVESNEGSVHFNGAVGAGSNGALYGLNATGYGFSADSLDIGAGGLYVNTLGGPITQSGGFTVAGTSTFVTNNQAITLTNAGNDFQGTVSLTGGDTQIVNNAPLILGAVSTASLIAGGAGGIQLTQNVNTTGAQTYQSAVTLGADITAASSGGGNIDFTSTVDGAHALAVDTTGATTFEGAVGGNTALTSLTTDAGGSTTLDGNVTTSGAQTYNDAVTLGGDVTATSTGNGNIDFASTVDGAHNLAMNTGGVTTLGGVVGGTNSLTSLTTDAAGSTILDGNVSTTGAQTYGDAVTLGNNATLTSSGNGNITFGSTLDGSQNLTVNTGGTTTFGADVGDNSTLNSLDIVQGTTVLDGNISTIGTQTYGGPVLLGANVLLYAYSGATFDGTVDNAGPTQQTLSVEADNSLVKFNGAVGGGSNGALYGLNVTSDGFSANSLNIGLGGLSVQMVGNTATITQTGAFTVAGTSSFNAGSNAITLTNAGNDFTGTVNLTGGTTQITDANALTLGTVNTGALTASSTGNLNLGSGTITGALDATSNGGAITQTGPLTITGTSTLDAGNGSITLTDAANDFGGAVTATGDGVALTDANNLTVASLTDNNNGSVSLVAGGTLSTGAINTGTGNLTLAANGGSFTTTGDLSGANVSLTGRDGLNLANNISATGTLSLDSTNAAINQTAGNMTAGGVTSVNAGTGAITLADAGNDFQNTVNLTGGTTQITDANALSLGAVNTSALTVTSTGALNLGSGIVNGNLGATSNGGAISQSGALTITGSSNLNAGSGSIALANANNDFQGAVTASGTGVSLTDKNDLTLASLTDNNNGSVSLIAGGNLNLPAGAINTGTGDLTLAANGGTLSANGALTGNNVSLSGYNGLLIANDITAAGTLDLVSGNGAISQSGGILSAATLTGGSKGATTLNDANLIGTLGNFSANGFSLTDAQALTVAGALNAGAGTASLTTTTGDLAVNGTVSGGAVNLNSTGNLVINAGVNSGAGATTLTSGGTIDEGAGGSITAGTLTGSSSGATNLGGANLISNVGNFNANGFDLDNAQALNVAGTVNGGTGATSITTTAGALNVNSAVSGNGVSLDGNGGLAINAAVNGGAGTATLTSGSTISEGAAGVVIAGTLTGSSTGATNLTGANQVGTLGDFSANGFSLTNAQALTAAGVIDGGAGGTTLKTTSGDLTISGTVGNTGGATGLTSAGAITEAAGGVVNATTLTGSSAGATTLNGANQIASLGNFTANGFSLTDARTLTIAGAVNGGSGATDIATSGAGSDIDVGASGSVAGTGVALASSGAINAAAGSTIKSNNAALSLGGTSLALDGALDAGTGTVTLASGGAITQASGTGTITAGTLTGSSTGATTLNGANKVASLGNFSANGFSLTDAQALAVNGTVDGGASGTALKTTAGDLTINDTVGNAAGATTLTSAGAINESASGVVKATTLTGSSGGATALNGANQIANLGNFTANGFSLTDAQSLTVAAGSTVNGGSSTVLVTSGAGHDLDIDGTVGNAGGAVTLASAGSINEGASGEIVANTLAGSSTGDATLDGANRINTLGQFSAANLSLVDAQALSVVGPLSTTSGTGNISLTTTGAGNVLSVGQVLTGGTITLDSGGALNVTNDVEGSTVNLAAHGNLAINAAVNSGAGTTTLTQSGAGSISESAGGSIIAGTLTGSSQGTTALNGANKVATLSNFSGNGFSLTNAQALTVAGNVNGGTGAASLATTSGALNVFGDVTGGSVSLNGAGGLGVNGSVNSGTGTTTLASGAAISEGSGGAITAGTLTGHSSGSTTLNGPNSISNLGSFSANGFSLTNAKTLTLAAGATVDGGANTSLTTTAGNITINGVLKGTSTRLKSAGSIGEGAQGVINAGTLTGSATGAANLDGANRVANLGNFSAGGFSLTNAQSLTLAAGATVDGGANTSLATTSGDLAIDGTVKGTTTTLESAGAINEGAGGVVNAGTLTGSSIADTTLNGANRIGTLGAFTARDLYLTDAQALVVDGPVSSTGNAGDISLTTTGGTANTLTVNQAVHGRNITLASAGDLSVGNTVTGTSVKLAATGNLGINAAVDSGTGVVTLTQAGTGAISEGATGAITAGTLSGSATGTTTLGTSANFMNNQVDVLGNFSSPAGFSFTNGRTLTLSSVNGSTFTVDAGQSDLYLAVRNGDLLETGNTWLYDGQGTWSASGHIGLATAPIYVIGVSNQFVQDIGLPPAYFYALDTSGKLLPITGGPSVNVPTAALSGGSENTNGHSDNYIDVSVFTANYRSFGIVPSGILLPEDQQLCSPTEQSLDECPEGNN